MIRPFGSRRRALVSPVRAWSHLPWLALVALACGSQTPTVPRYPHPEGAPAEPVGFPPPPALIEHLEATPPARGCLWLDGQWVWAAQRWDWQPGRWVRAPEGCRYSPPTLEWAPVGERGTLYYRPGRWYSGDELRLCADPVSCPAPSPVLPTAQAGGS